MAGSKRGVRGAQGVKGRRGPSGKTGPKGVGRTGPKGTQGIRGATGKKGTAGARGKAGIHGPAGTLAGSEHEEILIVQRRLEGIYEGLDEQRQLTAEIQSDLEVIHAKLPALTKPPK